MSGVIINPTPAITVLEKQRHSKDDVFLTEFNTNNEPQIQGVFEIAGSLAEFATAESIAGWSGLSNGTVYIKVVPNISGGTITAEFTDVAPTWDIVKGGWYGTGANANHRYLYRLLRAEHLRNGS